MHSVTVNYNHGQVAIHLVSTNKALAIMMSKLWDPATWGRGSGRGLTAVFGFWFAAPTSP